ncbi:MAG TPA: hypothetical protein VFF33_12695 [Ignavibacteriaceae bacterium]|nr:hypothetical protein [Ignavibacteriaceae bacterium]
MNKLRAVILILLLFVLIRFITVNVFELDFSLVFSYLLMTIGILSVFFIFGKNKKFLLFVFSSTFLIGVVLLVDYMFEFTNPGKLLLPASLFIPSINFLIIFIEDTDNKLFLWLSFLLFISGFIVSIFLGSIKLETFLQSLSEIIKSYWLFIVLMLMVLLVLYIFDKNSEQQKHNI